MRKSKLFCAVALCATMFAGCASTPAEPKEVSTTCTTDLNGMTVSVRLTAPKETDEITNIDMIFDMPFSAIRDAAGDAAASLSDDDIKEVLEGSEDVYISQISSMLGVDKESISAKMNDDSLTMEVNMEFNDETKALFGIEEGEALTYKEIVDSADESGFTCE